MKKPNKEPVTIFRESNLMHGHMDYTPDDLRKIADQMESKNIESLEIGYSSSHGDYFIACEVTTKETPEEAAQRYEKQMIDYNNWLQNEPIRKEKEKQKLIQQAKQLGLKVIE